MKKRKRFPKNTTQSIFSEPEPGFKTRAGQKIAKALLKATAALRPKARRFWGRPKPIKVSDLRVGDLAFSRFKSRLTDGIASAVTGFPPMHVSLYVGEGKFFDLSRRAKIVLSETLPNYYSEPFIFRPQLSAGQKEKIVSLARQMVKDKVKGNEDIRMRIGTQRTLGIKVRNPTKEGYICSNAIAEFFAEAGANLVPRVHPSRTSPTDLMKSKKLKLING